MLKLDLELILFNSINRIVKDDSHVGLLSKEENIDEDDQF